MGKIYKSRSDSGNAMMLEYLFMASTQLIHRFRRNASNWVFMAMLCVRYRRRCAMNLNTLFIHNEISTEPFSFNKLNDKKMRTHCYSWWCRGNRNVGGGRRENEFNTSASKRLDEICSGRPENEIRWNKNWYLRMRIVLMAWRYARARKHSHAPRTTTHILSEFF